MRLTKLQKQLCNLLQEGLPICSRPFAEIAKSLDSDETEVLQQINKLKTAGLIRRISAITNYRAIGRIGTLVTAHIPETNLPDVIEAVNALPGVSHNYLRENFYNLWFTLQANSTEQIDATLSNLSARFDIDFHSLPVERFFKLDVRFDANLPRRVSGTAGNQAPMLSQNIEPPPTRCDASRRENETVELNESQKLILSKLQNELQIITKPFDFLCSEGLEAEEILKIVQGLIDKSVIRRIAAVLNYRKLGFAANVLFVCEVEQNRIVEAGKKLARFGAVSHCYQRKTFDGWAYNLFAMMHGRSMGEIQHVIDKFTKIEKIDSYELLPTAAELKKQPVKHRFQ